MQMNNLLRARRQNGFSLVETLLSLTLGSLLITIMLQAYVNYRRDYENLQQTLAREFDLQMIVHLLRNSIQYAGYLPCPATSPLDIIDRRNNNAFYNPLMINKDKHLFVGRADKGVYALPLSAGDKLFFIPTLALKPAAPVLISDCRHAEIHTVKKVLQKHNGTLIDLEAPLHFSYPDKTYITQWVEEEYFLANNSRNSPGFYYRQHHKEELSDHISQWDVSIHKNRAIVLLQLDNDEKITVITKNLRNK